MGIDPAAQGLQALLSLACGTALGFLYDLTAALLRRARLEKLLILLYLPYSLLAAVLLFLLGSIAGRGQLRLFMLLGMLLGGLLYLLPLRRAGRFLAEGIAALFAFFCRILLKPLRILRKTLKKFFVFAKKYFHFAKEWVKMHVGFLESVFSSIPAEAEHEAAKIGYRYHYDPFDAGVDRLHRVVPVADERAHRGSRAGKGSPGRRGPGPRRQQCGPGIRDRAQRRPGHGGKGRPRQAGPGPAR
ncbi:MAG: hypothetical protein IKN89_08745 [Oscillospiraceae bacterium]|jgi:hypothetical protein|nr:hypothetical protein [Oscillospiraceae bacterium]